MFSKWSFFIYYFIYLPVYVIRFSLSLVEINQRKFLRMFPKLVAEIIGTFIFLSVIIFTVNGSKDMGVNWLKIGLGLAIAVLLVGSISGAHLNPAVSLMFYLNNQLPADELGLYWVGQVIGASLALILYRYFDPYLRASKNN
jgi:glycerol uptake facilitator protein